MTWTISNILTALRLPLAAAFFVLIAFYSDASTDGGQAVLIGSMVLFALAGITDFLDGYLARRLNQVTTFGRIVDPFVDKVMIVGSFVMLAAPNFTLAGMPGFETNLPRWLTGNMASAVQPWMVVVVLAREFIVSAVRGYSESQGKSFAATFAGKLKFIVQVFAIGTILVQLAFFPNETWAVVVKVAAVWAAVAATVLSGVAYGKRSWAVMSNPDGEPEK
jgi:CDP-diacylglycerol---glycerol-3-phosphate 3-phosphatidyltransferase